MEKNEKLDRNHTFFYMQPSKIPGPLLSKIDSDIGSLYTRTANFGVSEDITSTFVLLINPLNKYMYTSKWCVTVLGLSWGFKYTHTPADVVIFIPVFCNKHEAQQQLRHCVNIIFLWTNFYQEKLNWRMLFNVLMFRTSLSRMKTIQWNLKFLKELKFQ